MPKIYQKYSEHEIQGSNPIQLSLPDGRLNPQCMGWSRRPVQVSNIRGYWLRKKLWNYWCVATPEFLFSVTLSNIDYLGMIFAYFLDFKTFQFMEQTVTTLLGKDCVLPDTVEGLIEFERKEMTLSFLDQGHSVDLAVQSPDFKGQELKAKLHLERPPDLESLNVVIPWSENRYHFTSKQNCLPASGSVQVGPKLYTLDPQRDFACLDFGRGIWKYNSFWNWASFSTRVGAGTLGVNLGAGWTEGSGMTENSLLVNGRVEKLSEDVIFNYDPQHFMHPWRLKTAFSNQVDLTFIPIYERVAKTDLAVLRSEVHQMIGKFSGAITTQNGQRFEISEVIGWAEEHRARW